MLAPIEFRRYLLISTLMLLTLSCGPGSDEDDSQDRPKAPPAPQAPDSQILSGKTWTGVLNTGTPSCSNAARNERKYYSNGTFDEITTQYPRTSGSSAQDPSQCTGVALYQLTYRGHYSLTEKNGYYEYSDEHFAPYSAKPLTVEQAAQWNREVFLGRSDWQFQQERSIAGLSTSPVQTALRFTANLQFCFLNKDLEERPNQDPRLADLSKWNCWRSSGL